MHEPEVIDGTLLWEPTPESIARSGLGRYLTWLAAERHIEFEDYASLWDWSVSDLEGFWESLWDYFDIKSEAPFESVLGNRAMPGADWFPGATLNYAEHALQRRDDSPAVIAVAEESETIMITFSELNDLVAAALAVGQHCPQARAVEGRASQHSLNDRCIDLDPVWKGRHHGLHGRHRIHRASIMP